MENNVFSKWVYSDNEDDFSYSEEYNSVAEAIEAAVDDDNIASDDFYIGRKKKVDILGIDVDNILDNIAENTSFGFDDYSADYLYDVKDEHKTILSFEIHDVITNWMKRFDYLPSWYEIVDIKHIRLNDIKK